MAAQPAYLPSNAGTVVTEASGAAPATDTIPDNVVLVLRNTGVGTHVVTLGVNATYDGFTASGTGTRPYTLTAGQVMVVRVPGTYGDANGRCTLSVDATPTEVKYSVIGA